MGQAETIELAFGQEVCLLPRWLASWIRLTALSNQNQSLEYWLSKPQAGKLRLGKQGEWETVTVLHTWQDSLWGHHREFLAIGQLHRHPQLLRMIQDTKEDGCSPSAHEINGGDTDVDEEGGDQKLGTRELVIDETLMESRSPDHLHRLEVALGRPTHRKGKQKQPLLFLVTTC